MRWSALLVLALLAPGVGSAADMITGQAEVVDGDGLAIGPVRIRLHGIDAPELGQRCAERGGGTWHCDEAAANRLEDLIGGSAVSCEPLDSDAYGRIIARCTANGADLAAVLASEGRVLGVSSLLRGLCRGRRSCTGRGPGHLAGVDGAAVGLSGGSLGASGGAGA